MREEPTRPLLTCAVNGKIASRLHFRCHLTVCHRLLSCDELFLLECWPFSCPRASDPIFARYMKRRRGVLPHKRQMMARTRRRQSGRWLPCHSDGPRAAALQTTSALLTVAIGARSNANATRPRGGRKLLPRATVAEWVGLPASAGLRDAKLHRIRVFFGGELS